MVRLKLAWVWGPSRPSVFSAVAIPAQLIAVFSPAQSAWSDITKPRSVERLRRTPRKAIQPLAKAVEAGLNRACQLEFNAEGGQIIVVDVDRPTNRHGIPPKLLFCEFAAVGFKLVEFVERPDLKGYFARFERGETRAEPEAIAACSNGQ